MANKNEEYRILLLTQIFTIVLVLKGISATYLATKYSITNQLWIVNHYILVLKWIPIILLVPLFLVSLPLVLNIKKDTKRVLDIIGLSIFFIGILALVII